MSESSERCPDSAATAAAPVVPAVAGAAAPHRTAPEDRVPLPQKVAYGLGTFVDMWGHWLYPNIAFQVFAIFLAVKPELVGIAIIFNRIIDAVSDPLFGWLSDNTRTRLGRRRPYLLVGAVLAGLGLPLLVAVTPGWGTTQVFGWEVSNYFWFMIGSSALYLPVVSCFNMPYVSLGNELTPDYHERTALFSVKNAVQKIPEVGLFFAGQFFTMAVWVDAHPGNLAEKLLELFTTTAAWAPAADGAKPNMLIGAQVFCVLAGGIVMLAGLTTGLVVRERYFKKLVAGRQEKISLRETLWETLRCQPFRIQVAMNLAYSLGLSMVGTLGFAATLYYVCRGNLSEGNVWNFWMGVSGMVSGFLGIPTFAFIARRFGKRHAMAAVFTMAIAVFIATWWLYTPEIRWLQVFASGSIAFTGAGFWTLLYSILADVVDYDELQTGKRREGAFAGCNSWITKVGMAVGAGVSFFILGWIGFDAKLEGNQSEHTILMIRFLLASIPIVGLVFALVALARFPLSQERMIEIRRELEARRGKV